MAVLQSFNWCRTLPKRIAHSAFHCKLRCFSSKLWYHMVSCNFEKLQISYKLSFFAVRQKRCSWWTMSCIVQSSVCWSVLKDWKYLRFFSQLCASSRTSSLRHRCYPGWTCAAPCNLAGFVQPATHLGRTKSCVFYFPCYVEYAPSSIFFCLSCYLFVFHRSSSSFVENISEVLEPWGHTWTRWLVYSVQSRWKNV